MGMYSLNLAIIPVPPKRTIGKNNSVGLKIPRFNLSFQLLFCASALDKLAWKCAGMLAIEEYLGAVDPYLIDALGKL